MELKATRYEVDRHGVATLWLHRPHRRNAWTGRMHAEYRWIFAELEADPAVRVVVVTGSDGAFCVGGDSEALAGHAERGSYDAGLPAEVASPGHGVRPELDHDFAWQWGLRFPVIAAVNGACAGVGLSLACFCDLRFGAAGAKLTTASPKLGLPAEYGISWVLPRLVGRHPRRRPAPVGTGGAGRGGRGDGPVQCRRARRRAGRDRRRLRPPAGDRGVPASLAATKRQLYDDLLHARRRRVGGDLQGAARTR